MKTNIYKTVDVYHKMTKMLVNCRCEDDYGLIWDDFWNLNKGVALHIAYYDPDTTHEEDILARYYAIKNYLIERGVEL